MLVSLRQNRHSGGHWETFYVEVAFFLWIKNMPKVFHGLQILRGELLVHEGNLFDSDAMFP